jgi:hypothetical protein
MVSSRTLGLEDAVTGILVEETRGWRIDDAPGLLDG